LSTTSGTTPQGDAQRAYFYFYGEGEMGRVPYNVGKRVIQIASHPGPSFPTGYFTPPTDETDGGFLAPPTPAQAGYIELSQLGHDNVEQTFERLSGEELIAHFRRVKAIRDQLRREGLA
jgi:hypothetical protein